MSKLLLLALCVLIGLSESALAGDPRCPHTMPDCKITITGPPAPTPVPRSFWRDVTPAEVAAADGAGWHVPAMPPKRFDYFNPLVSIKRIPPDQIATYCARGRKVQPKWPSKACIKHTHWTGTRWHCEVVLPTSNPHLAVMLRHEMAHCNGWPSSHPL